MTVFSRAFVRKRVISLATTASVAATSLALAQGSTSSYHVRGAMPVQYVADRPDYYEESPFLSENDAAMNKMMANMTVKPTGDVDRDFVAMMVPHHQGAIEMAQAELRYGHNEQFRRLAQEIVVNQPPFVISLLTLCSRATEAAFADEAPYLRENDATMNKMMSDMVIKPTGDVDRDFVAMMTPHHQGAIEMARSVLRSGRNEQIRRLAQEVIVTQQQEIAAMRLAIGDSLPPSIPSPTQASVSSTSSSTMPSILTSLFQKAGEPQ